MAAAITLARAVVLTLLLPTAALAETEAKPAAPVPPLAAGESRNVTVDLRDYTVRGLTTPEARQRVATFDAELARFGRSATIASCRGVVSIPALMPGGSDSFGGACVLRDGSGLLICDDAAMSHFATAPIEATARPDVAFFVIHHCYGT